MGLFDRTSKQSIRLTGEQKALNRLYLQDIQSIMAATGGKGTGAFLGERPDLYQPQGQEAELFGQIAGLGEDIGAGDLSMMPGTRELYSMATGTALEDAYKNLFDRIIGTELANQSTLSGLGGRGSPGYFEFANRYLTGLAPTIFGQKAQMLGQIPGLQAQGAQTMLGSLGTGAAAAGVGRQGALQDYLNRANLTSSRLSGIPTVGVKGQYNTQFANFQDYLQSVGQIAGVAGSVAGMACWIARAIYGDDSPKADQARFYVTLTWPGWAKALYRAVGPWVAKTPLKWLMKPYFDWVVAH